MGEIKQANFRIDQDTADAFRKFCEDNGFNQAQGFDHIMQVVEMDRAKAVAPSRTTEIESFEKSVKDIMASYLYSIEINQNAEERIREQFKSDLERKDKTIDDLQQKTEQLKAEKEAAEAVAAEAVKAKDQAEKEAATAEKVRAAAEKTAADKQTIADTLAAKLAETEKKADGYEDLKAALSSSENARRDAETAKAVAIAEISEVHRKEVAEIRAKLDARTEDLMQAKQKISDLQLELQAAQAKIEAMDAK